MQVPSFLRAAFAAMRASGKLVPRTRQAGGSLRSVGRAVKRSVNRLTNSASEGLRVRPIFSRFYREPSQQMDMFEPWRMGKRKYGPINKTKVRKASFYIDVIGMPAIGVGLTGLGAKWALDDKRRREAAFKKDYPRHRVRRVNSGGP